MSRAGEIQPARIEIFTGFIKNQKSPQGEVVGGSNPTKSCFPIIRAGGRKWGVIAPRLQADAQKCAKRGVDGLVRSGN